MHKKSKLPKLIKNKCLLLGVVVLLSSLEGGTGNTRFEYIQSNIKLNGYGPGYSSQKNTEIDDTVWYKWALDGGKWKYVNKQNGEPIIGSFYDKNGDIYITDSNGNIITSWLNDKKQYFNSDGRLSNLGISLVNDEYAKDLAVRISRGEKVFIETSNKGNNYINEFIEYFVGQNYIYEQPCTLIIDRNNSNKIGISLYKSPVYDKNSVLQLIKNTYLSTDLNRSSLDASILDIANRLKSNSTYDDNYQTRNIVDCIIDKRACCWQYAKIFSEIINMSNLGITTEVVDGEFDGIGHSWVRYKKADGTWRYLDPTYYVETGKEQSLNIDYSYYLSKYITQSRVNIVK